MIDFMDDLKKEKDLIYEKYQELIVENQKIKKFFGEREPLDIFEKESNDQFYYSTKINMKLSQWMKQNKNRLIDFDYSESHSYSSLSLRSFSSSYQSN